MKSGHHMNMQWSATEMVAQKLLSNDLLYKRLKIKLKEKLTTIDNGFE